jgi:hypothetical protein
MHLKASELRKTRENPVAGIVHGHRFLAVRALYFRDIGRAAGGFFLIAVPDCDSVTIRAHWRMRMNCPVSA